ncbi:hypothetical protein JQS43_12215 [Natronosporangium hydrolyticum]|uniref:Nucleotidase n=1 Tax=Natronosporangium hydrolyticum TaxID=2811111 RepID=A0A895YS80_9ACTN|nr:hypothetical protein [Natronosporangium hydrolyticum]QSB16960.1 hypothetical protein JQS43_12215 [Natronosporangium hydrolyticum]
MRLGIDLDGVVADFDNCWLDRYHSEFGGERMSTPIEWDGLHRLTHFPDMPAFWDWVRLRRIFRQLEPIPGALAGLRSLAADGHDIVIISAKFDWAIPETLEWIAEHRLPTREIHFRGDKHEVACDVYLDDSPIALPNFVKERPEALVCRMVAPWNTPIDGAVDIPDWDRFLTVVADREPVGDVAQR